MIMHRHTGARVEKPLALQSQRPPPKLRMYFATAKRRTTVANRQVNPNGGRKEARHAEKQARQHRAQFSRTIVLPKKRNGLPPASSALRFSAISMVRASIASPLAAVPSAGPSSSIAARASAEVIPSSVSSITLLTDLPVETLSPIFAPMPTVPKCMTQFDASLTQA